jgi:hypothetical protein
MKPGRDRPCPCGSGKGYRSCCGAGECGVLPALRLPGHPPQPTVWEAGFTALPAVPDADPAALPVALLVAEARGAVLFQEMLLHPPAGPEEVWREVERAVMGAARAAGHLPERLLVRGEALAAALASALGPRDVEVAPAAELPGLERFAAELRGAVGGRGGAAAAPSPQSWARWGLPAADVAELFRASAAFYRAAPWRVVSEEKVLEAVLPGGRRLSVCILGQEGLERGIALYEDVGDLVGVLVAAVGEPGRVPGFHGSVTYLVFRRRGELPQPMQREVAASGWEVASPRAYPLATALNTPGGGLSRAGAAELAAVLAAVPAYVRRYRESLRRWSSSAVPEWLHPETGVVLRASRFGWGGERGKGLWDPPTRLDACCAQGEGARPAAALEGPPDPEGGAEVAARFGAWLAREGLSAATVRRHAMNAALFLDHLLRDAGVPLHAVTELELRRFLYEALPAREDAGRSGTLAVPVSLGRFFSFLYVEERLDCPWARAVLRDRESFEIRLSDFHGGFRWSGGEYEWYAELEEDLDDRLLVPGARMAGGGEWGEGTGPAETRLRRELQRRWLLWRDRGVRAGHTEPAELRRRLEARQRKWERTPHPELDGRTPVEAVRAERRGRS